MSLVRIRSAWSSVTPRVVVVDGLRIVAHSARAWTWLTLGAYARSVVVDGRRRRVDLRTRFAVHRSSESVDFGDVDHVAYDFDSLPTGFGWLGRTDQSERFSVALVLAGAEARRVPLFDFVGEGAVNTGLAGVLIDGDSLVDAEGTQEEESRAYATAVASMIGVTLGPRLEVPTTIAGGVARCDACGRARPRREGKCLYCGAPLPTGGGPFRSGERAPDPDGR